jgi:cyanophycinase
MRLGRTLCGVAALLVTATFLTRVSLGEDKSTPPDARFFARGIDGTLILCPEKIPQAARDRFFELAGKDKARIVILDSGKERTEAAKELAEAWQERKADVTIVPNEGGDEAQQALSQATGVWLLADTALVPAVKAAMKRGVVGVSGRAAGMVGAALLPGTLVDASFHDDKALRNGLEQHPGLFGIGLGKESALLVRGRHMEVLHGQVTILLGAAKGHGERTVTLMKKVPSDLTMWRRAAIARTEPPFPPDPVPTPDVPNGSLIIIGGGGVTRDVTRKFIELAGGPEATIVVLPIAGPDPTKETESRRLKEAGAKNVVVLTATDRKEIDSPDYLRVLAKAGGIYFCGGRQWHYVDAFEGTKALQAMRDVLRRGGVIGGSSAGATIQGHYLCRGNPLGPKDMMCEGYERGLSFLPGVAIDQHFTERNRFADMNALMKARPKLLGIGIDESTAILVHGQVAEVLGKSAVHFYDGAQPDHVSLKAGQRYDLKSRKVLPGRK